MQVDLKQVVAAALTIMVVCMLGNMVRHDHFSPAAAHESNPQGSASIETQAAETVEGTVASVVSKASHELWERHGPVLEQCWSHSLPSRRRKTGGYVLVRLSNGPQYHRLQVADAVVVAQTLGATLVLPTIKEAAKEQYSDFDQIYDVNNFISSLKDVVRVVGRLPENLRSSTPTVVKVPCKVTPEYIQEKVVPVFTQESVLRVVSVFSPSCLRFEDPFSEELKALQCLSTYSTLKFNSKVQKIGQKLLNKMRKNGDSVEGGGGGHVIAVDMRKDLLNQKGCKKTESSKKKCFNANEVAKFLEGLGFSSKTAIYVTESKWDSSLDPISDIFENVYTKESGMSMDDGGYGKTQLEKAVDFYVCTHSDVFVPAISGIFYVSVAGERIAAGKTQIFVPTKGGSPSLSQFITKKDHAVYSCFCQPSGKEK